MIRLVCVVDGDLKKNMSQGQGQNADETQSGKVSDRIHKHDGDGAKSQKTKTAFGKMCLLWGHWLNFFCMSCKDVPVTSFLF